MQAVRTGVALLAILLATAAYDSWTRPARAAQGRGVGTSFPAQQRAPDSPALVDRGKQIYEISCRACHGADLRGGDLGGPNLLRSDVALNDEHGELITPIVRGSRASAGMDAIKMSDDEVTAVSAYIHSILAKARSQGAPPAGPAVDLNILVGDAAAGQAAFTAKCASCHSASGDLKGIAARVSNPTQLQNLWVGGGRGRPRTSDGPPTRRDATVTVTQPSGQKFEGRLERVDDFNVTLIFDDGSRRTFGRVGDVPKVEIHDPLEAHKTMLLSYSDREIHDVTAYLVTLK